MKKLFTMLGATLMMGSFAANAGNPITALVSYWGGSEWVDAQPFETELTKNVDGSLTIKDFLNSGYPMSFKFNENIEPDSTSSVSACGNIFAPSGYLPYLMISSDFKLGDDGWPADWNDYMLCKYFATEDSEAINVSYPYIFDGEANVDYTYVSKNNLTENPDQYEYYAALEFGGSYDDNSYAYVYVEIYFNMPPVEVPISVQVWDWDVTERVGEDFETGLVKNEDGSFTMTDFFNSDYPISFTFDVPAEEGDESAITFVGNVDRDTYGVSFLDSEGEDFSCVLYPIGSRKGTTLWYPYAYEGISYSYVMKLTEEQAEYYGGEYMGAISFAAVTSGWEYYVLFFYFNLSETSGSTDNNGTDEPSTEEPITYVPSTQNVTIEVNDYYYNKVADSYTANVSVSEDGSVTISDVLNSGQPMTFTFVRPDVNSWSSAIKVTSPTYYYYGTPYLLTPDGENYVNGKAYDYLGAEGATEINTLAVGNSYIYRYDIENDGYDNEYYASIAMYGYIGDNYTDWFYLNFYFNMTEDTTGVEVVEDSDAPVEYYNLNGVKVANPSNGIFIRKQGNTVKKVVIK